jgi:predicted house-cleaning noncanonical NTP pyrophosphatase (MazG superfamily)
MGKLVRDRIPGLISAGGGKPNVRVLDEQGFDAALMDKLLEEATELRDADVSDRLEEAADVYEVLLSILDAQGLTAQDLVAAAHDKRQRRGGFSRRLWLGMD